MSETQALDLGEVGGCVHGTLRGPGELMAAGRALGNLGGEVAEVRGPGRQAFLISQSHLLRKFR